MSAQTTPVDQDAHAATAELQQRAAADYAVQQAAERERAAQGGYGTRTGILPGGGR